MEELKVLYICLVDSLPFSSSKQKGPWRIWPFSWDYGWWGWMMKSLLPPNFCSCFSLFSSCKMIWLFLRATWPNSSTYVHVQTNNQGMLFPKVLREKFYRQMDAHLSHVIYLHNTQGTFHFKGGFCTSVVQLPGLSSYPGPVGFWLLGTYLESIENQNQGYLHYLQGGRGERTNPPTPPVWRGYWNAIWIHK